ncbi:MAG: hypothetical protein ILNGONEN_01960 [Syntrophorhabdaceae bacterium]|nr:hypothetical protein [Syntrophorhabdaceae bacterium]
MSISTGVYTTGNLYLPDNHIYLNIFKEVVGND